jgi:two-component system sensor histidine kinase VicK
MKANLSTLNLKATAAVSTILSRRKKKEDLFAYLNIAAEELARARDTSSALEKISQLIVPKFANWFSIDLIRSGQMEELVLAHEDPEMIQWARQFREAYPIDLRSDSGAAKVIKTGIPSFIPVVTREMIVSSVKEPERLEAILKLNLQSVITVALFNKDVITGVISFISSIDGKYYDKNDLSFAQNLANHIGLSLENARLNEQLQAGERKLEQILTELPAKVVFFRGKELVVETVNEAALRNWNKKRSATIGKPLLEILPEMSGQPFPLQLKEVFETGIAIAKKEIPASLKLPDGSFRTIYNDYFYQPLTDTEGNRIGVLATSLDVTDKVNSRMQLEKNEEELQAANEKLLATNEELAETQQNLQQLLNAVSESEFKFKNIILQAPVAIAIYKGPQFIIDVYNKKILEFWGRSAEEVAGLPLFEALPEAKDQGLEELLSNVYTTGERFIANELPVKIRRKGVLEDIWISFIHVPLWDLHGNIEGVIMICHEVTEEVTTRKEIERAYEQARLSKEAAQLGTFDMDLDKGTMEWDERCRTLFGISHNNKVTYNDDFVTGLHPEDRERITGIIKNEVMVQSESNGKYDVEYRTIGAEDGQLRWVRAKGQVYFNSKGEPKRFIGSVLDITEQKQDEQRKNDFIGMVSHELKTPLTSLNAIIQVMNAKLKESNDVFLAGASEKADKQVKKMINLVNGFLNVSRLESGKIVINKQFFKLDELILECITEISLSVTSHQVIFEQVKPTVVYADRDKIGSVISNLLSNAVKYSPKGKIIKVNCDILGNHAQLCVKDEGIGIKPNELKKLFDRYYRVQSNYTQNISGFGIGLYLSAEIIQRHNGRIWAESEIGKGSTFYFNLPIISA